MTRHYGRYVGEHIHYNPFGSGSADDVYEVVALDLMDNNGCTARNLRTGEDSKVVCEWATHAFAIGDYVETSHLLYQGAKGRVTEHRAAAKDRRYVVEFVHGLRNPTLAETMIVRATTLRLTEAPTERCFECGGFVYSVFDHVDRTCPARP